jgi:hypothetical protein
LPAAILDSPRDPAGYWGSAGKRISLQRKEVMLVKRDTEEVPIEQMFAGVEAHLVEAEEILIPGLVAKVQDVRDAINRAYDVLEELEDRVLNRKSNA